MGTEPANSSRRTRKGAACLLDGLEPEFLGQRHDELPAAVGPNRVRDASLPLSTA
jgi:hypothetical protein